MITVALLHAVAVLSLVGANTSSQDGLVDLLRTHTGRHDRVYFSAEADPWLAQQAVRLAAMSDRLLVQMTGAGDLPSGNVSNQSFRLTTKAAADDPSLAGRTEGAHSGPVRFMKTLVQWYQVHVVERAKGDQLEIEPEVYLYRLR